MKFLDKLIANRYIILVGLFCTISGTTVKDFGNIDLHQMITLGNLLFIIGISCFAIYLYGISQRQIEMSLLFTQRNNDVDSYLKKIKEAIDTLQFDNVIGYFSNEYKIYNSASYKMDAELKYVYPKVIALSNNTDILEVKSRLSKHYGLTIHQVEDIIGS